MIATIQTYGVRETVADFASIAHQASATKPAMEEIYLAMLDIEDEAFENEGARSGFPRWSKLQLSTIVNKANKPNRGSKILQDVGTLKRAMTEERSRSARVTIFNTKITFQPKKPQYKFHQSGAPGSNLPPRPFLRFSDSDRAAFGREIMRHLTKKVKHGRIGINFAS